MALSGWDLQRGWPTYADKRGEDALSLEHEIYGWLTRSSAANRTIRVNWDIATDQMEVYVATYWDSYQWRGDDFAEFQEFIRTYKRQGV